MDAGGNTSWTAAPSDPLLAPGATAYFTFTTPLPYSAQPITAQANGGSWNSPATGSILGPLPTETDVTTLTLPNTGGAQNLQVTSTAIEFADHILWDYRVRNLNYVSGSYAGVDGFWMFSVEHPGATPASNLTNDQSWNGVDTGGSPVGVRWIGAQSDVPLPVAPGQEADFSFTTPLAAIGLVGATAGSGDLAIYASGFVLGAVAPRPGILLKSVAYSGDTFSTVYRDAGEAYASPQWFNANDDGDASSPALKDRNYPVAFARNSTVTFTTTIKLTGAVPPNDGSHLYLVGLGPGGINTPILDEGRPFGDVTLRWSPTTMSPLPNYVHAYTGGFNVNWSYMWSTSVPNWNPAGWTTFGTSNNVLYVTYGKSLAPAYHSLVYNATVSAEGKSSWQDVLLTAAQPA